MKLLLDSAWRAAAYCLLPRVMLLSLLPLLIIAALTALLGHFFWAASVDGARAAMSSMTWLDTVTGWLASLGIGSLKSTLAPLVVVLVSLPAIVLVSLLVVATLMTPSMLALVRDRRFPRLERKRGGSFIGSLWGVTWATALAVVAFVVTLPSWFVPPLVLVVPPLIWGWLTYRVMSYDVLAEHASREERRTLIARHRVGLLTIGIVTGYLGAAPSLIWVSGLLGLALAVVLVPLAIWAYTLVFAFSALWFAHYALTALQALRDERAAAGSAKDTATAKPTAPRPIVIDAVAPKARTSPQLLPPSESWPQ